MKGSEFLVKTKRACSNPTSGQTILQSKKLTKEDMGLV